MDVFLISNIKARSLSTPSFQQCWTESSTGHTGISTDAYMQFSAIQSLSASAKYPFGIFLVSLIIIRKQFNQEQTMFNALSQLIKGQGGRRLMGHPGERRAATEKKRTE